MIGSFSRVTGSVPTARINNIGSTVADPEIFKGGGGGGEGPRKGRSVGISLKWQSNKKDSDGGGGGGVKPPPPPNPPLLYTPITQDLPLVSCDTPIFRVTGNLDS